MPRPRPYITLDAEAITASFPNSDPKLEKFVCTHVLNVTLTPDPRAVEVLCVVTIADESREVHTVHLTIGNDGTLYGDI